MTYKLKIKNKLSKKFIKQLVRINKKIKLLEETLMKFKINTEPYLKEFLLKKS